MYVIYDIKKKIERYCFHLITNMNFCYKIIHGYTMKFKNQINRRNLHCMFRMKNNLNEFYFIEFYRISIYVL